jgi:8-oxo-dGTP diphosphatase
VWFTRSVPSRHTISTLLYCFNEADEILLMERAQQPNMGMWSPPGGKLHIEDGESPHQCGCREAVEELGLIVQARDLHLTGIISEQNHDGRDHWLMFLFELKWKMKELPAAHREGRFEFIPRAELNRLQMPVTDREQIWPLFWKYRGGFFAAHCEVKSKDSHIWFLEESSDGNADH